MKNICILLFSLFAIGQAKAENRAIELKRNGQLIKKISLISDNQGNVRSDYSDLLEINREVFNVWANKNVVYSGHDFMQLMVWVYGPMELYKAKKINFRSLTGKQTEMNINLWQEAMIQKYRWGVLGYKEEGKVEVTSFVKDGKELQPGPFFLMWTDFSEGDNPDYELGYKTVFQIKEINLVF